MIADETVLEVLRGHAAGLSARKIARLLKVSRGTVANYVNSERALKSVAKDPEAPRVPLYRCPGCGGLTYYSPCRVCIANAYKKMDECDRKLELTVV